METEVKILNSQFDWTFNFRVFVNSLKTLGYFSQLEDWNVRYKHDGDIMLDNFLSRQTTRVNIADGMLCVEVRGWDPEGTDVKNQNIDLFETKSGWRNEDFYPETSPSPEAIAFLEHLREQGYVPHENFENLEIPCY